ncbi:MAG: ABC transporter substrate-binding protein, partial [Acidobacteriota bacterium]
MSAAVARILLPLCALTLVACPSPQGGGSGGDSPGGTSAITADIGDFSCDPVPVPDGDFELMGDPRACKGGEFVMETNSYPTHLNHYGPERSASHKYRYSELMFNTLVKVHPNTLEIIPELAHRWEEIDGGREIIFHIDPDAKWSDGKPITSKDVAHTFDMIFHDKIVEVVYKTSLENTGWIGTEVIDEHTIKCKWDRSSWGNIIGMEDFFIMPAHAIDMDTYLEEWIFEPKVVSGMYELGPYEEGSYFSFIRRDDFWGEGKRQFIGMGNFDRITWKYYRNSDLYFEAVKKGDIDFALITRAQRWAEDCDFERVQKGWIQKVKMYQRQPEVPSQMAFNLEHPIFKDRKVRKALMWLYDREYLIEELFYDQYASKQSFWANSVYANPDNEEISFNPRKALELLAEAGWTKKDTDG